MKDSLSTDLVANATINSATGVSFGVLITCQIGQRERWQEVNRRRRNGESGNGKGDIWNREIGKGEGNGRGKNLKG